MDIESIRKEALDNLKQIKNKEDLDLFKKDYLGKKGKIREFFSSIKDLPIEEKKTLGQKINQLASEIEEIFLLKEKDFNKEEKEEIDLTLPAKPTELGSLHPITQVKREMERIFQLMGFSVVEGPEIEDEWYNFDALNIPAEHPAKEMQDSFYVGSGFLLRTHTSPVQVRTMEKKAPHIPIRIIAPGKVYRRDDDATHSPMFHQVEGLVIDRQISLADLKGTLLLFTQQMFGEKRQVRLRPSFFPFTEPSAEVDMSCVICDGAGCRVCKDTGWIEILGSGMVHPNVLRMSGYDPEEYTGYAFGMGVERIAMIKYGIDDLRLFFANDFRMLRQFR